MGRWSALALSILWVLGPGYALTWHIDSPCCHAEQCHEADREHLDHSESPAVPHDSGNCGICRQLAICKTLHLDMSFGPAMVADICPEAVILINEDPKLQPYEAPRTSRAPPLV